MTHTTGPMILCSSYSIPDLPFTHACAWTKEANLELYGIAPRVALLSWLDGRYRHHREDGLLRGRLKESPGVMWAKVCRVFYHTDVCQTVPQSFWTGCKCWSGVIQQDISCVCRSWRAQECNLIDCLQWCRSLEKNTLYFVKLVELPFNIDQFSKIFFHCYTLLS